MSNEMVRHSGWERQHEWQAQVMEPVTTWFCEAIGDGQEQTVLDAACGTGLPSIAIAERLRSNGKVVATDVSPIMVDAVRRKAHEAGLSNLEAREMSLAALGFPDASFDAVTCKDGIMYCPDPVAGARELHRVLKPGGSVAITAWDEAARCPFFRTMFETLARFMGPPPDPRGPGPLRLSAPGALASVLRDAGFTDVVIERREVVFAFDSVAMHWDVIRAMAAPVEAAATKLPEPEVARLKAAFADALAPYTEDGRVRLPSTALCAHGRRA